MYDTDVYKNELESLTGKVFNGSITPIVFDLLKDSRHLDKLIKYLNKGEKPNVDNNKSDNPVRKENNNRPCFEEWFRNAERL